ncbi:MAG: hypothetical protein KIT84_35615 [Labilithrix sp.]|nr:hypothetical protein [Labilithrix sp.]MCW5816381.1 hypothetical protein [Labilithrix sp.]
MLLALVVACSVDVAPIGLRATPGGSGPVVRFDVPRDLPLPNDVATVADPTSRTGKRPSPPLDGATAMERRLRADLAALEGWGLSSSISVGFERSPTTDVRDPAIDVDAVFTRMATDEHDPANDPIYVVNLSTGIPALLDVGAGYSPLTVRDPWRYGPGDRKASESNLIFETVEEGAGLPFFAYEPRLDRDFDGVLDHPNVHDWYERETDTLLLRPIVPLAEMTEYAVVLTDRLRAKDGQPVRSPFEAIHHPTQRAGVARLLDWLTDNRLASYYGDIAGTGLEHVTFVWTFTTQPAEDDLRLLREGLAGNGPLGNLSRVTPAAIEGTRDVDRTCAGPLLKQALGLDDASVAAVNASLEHAGRIVAGSFRSPYLLGDPAAPDPDARFQIDLKSGAGDVRSDDVQFVLVLPKSSATRAAPFPVVVWGHDVGHHAEDALLYGGDYARQGVAFLAYNLPGRGLVLDDAAKGALAASCTDGLLGGRARGADLGGWWTGHVAHDRDVLRQGAVDGLNVVRLLRAGAFPDVGGEAAPIFVAGMGLGAITSTLVGAADPGVRATASIAGGGGLVADVALRSAATSNAEVLGPWVFAVPAGERADSRCRDPQRTVRVAASGRELEIACLEPAELGPDRTIVVTNVTASQLRCARSDRDGRFSIAIPTSIGDRLDVQVYDGPDAVGSYARCNPKEGAPIGRRIQSVEPNTESALVAPSNGLGIRRQSPALRRFRDLAQAVIDPADPAVVAARFGAEGRALLVTATIGDAEFPVSAQHALARAAGALPFMPPASVERLPAYADHAAPRDLYERLGRRAPMRWLVDTGTTEGIARFGKTRAGAECRANSTCAGAPAIDPYACATALFDPDWTSEGVLPFEQPHPDVPLRLARIAGRRTTDASTLAATWEPRLRGVPFAPDAAGWNASQPLLALFHGYTAPEGAHGWIAGDACRAWDHTTYRNALLARFFATNGIDLRYLSHPNTHGCLAVGSCDFFE